MTALTDRWYRSTTLDEMRRRRYRTVREIKTWRLTVPAGTEVEIVHKRDGLTIQGAACGCCGVSVRVKGVYPSDLELIDVFVPTSEEAS